MGEISKLSERCDSLQDLIAEIKEDRRIEFLNYSEKARQTLVTKDEFACEQILTAPTDVESSFESELGLVPKFGQFES